MWTTLSVHPSSKVRSAPPTCSRCKQPYQWVAQFADSTTIVRESWYWCKCDVVPDEKKGRKR